MGEEEKGNDVEHSASPHAFFLLFSRAHRRWRCGRAWVARPCALSGRVEETRPKDAFRCRVDLLRSNALLSSISEIKLTTTLRFSLQIHSFVHLETQLSLSLSLLLPPRFPPTSSPSLAAAPFASSAYHHAFRLSPRSHKFSNRFRINTRSSRSCYAAVFPPL